MPSSDGIPIRRILLVRTWLPLQGGGPTPPLGLLYVAGAVRAHLADIELRLVDMGLPDAGAGPQGVADLARDWQADVVGLSAMSCEAPLLAEVAAAVRRAHPAARIVVGGPHARVAGLRIFDEVDADASVIGEGEITFVEYLRALGSGGAPAEVLGLAFRGTNGPVRNPDRPVEEDIDRLPLPAWDLADLRAYGAFPDWAGPRRAPFHAPVLTSRGCPYGCVFCHGSFGRRFRARSPESVLAEMRHLHDRFGVRDFHILDDVFNYDEERAIRICESVRNMKVTLAFPNGLRADRMTPRLLDALEAAGTRRIHYGFETTSARMQERIGKHLDMARAWEVIAQTARRPIQTGAYFMLGLPGETIEEARATVDAAVRSPLDLAWFFKATAYPGTPLHEAVGGDVPSRDLHFYAAGPAAGGLPAPEVDALLVEAWERFHLKPGRLWRVFRKTPRKTLFLKGLLALLASVLLSRTVRRLRSAP